MKKILIINHSNPFDIGGGSFACRAYTKAFAELVGGKVDICLPKENVCKIDESIMVDYYLKVPRRSFFARAFSVITGDIQRNTSYVKDLLKKNQNIYDIAVCNGSFEGGALVDVFHKYGIRVITIHHNYEPEYVSDNEKIPVYRKIKIHHAYNYQKKAYLKSDINLFITESDCQICQREFGDTKALNRVIGVFEYQQNIETFIKNDNDTRLVFAITGSFTNTQGVDGVKYFFENLYHCLPENSKIIISGRNPTEEVISLCSQYENVELVPNPARMSDIINQADVYICPTRLGGGLKLRVMDGLRMGIPVITHSCSSRGYEVFHNTGFFGVFQNEQEFQTALTKIISNINNKRISRPLISEEYRKVFSYEAGLNRLKKIMTETHK